MSMERAMKISKAIRILFIKHLGCKPTLFSEFSLGFFFVCLHVCGFKILPSGGYVKVLAALLVLSSIIVKSV